MTTVTMIEQPKIMGKEFNIYGTHETPLFLAKDIANYIGHNKPFEMIQNIDEDEKLKAILSLSGQKREYWFLTENGMYEVLFQSRKQVAKDFKKQVKLALKSIRKHGMYATTELLNDPDLLIATAQRLKEEQHINNQLTLQVLQQEPLVTFASTVINTEDTILIRQLAKLASDKLKHKIGEKQLYQILRDWNIIQKNSTEPHQQYIKNGIFQLKETTNNGLINLVTKVTPKGQVYIINRLLQEQPEPQTVQQQGYNQFNDNYELLHDIEVGALREFNGKSGEMHLPNSIKTIFIKSYKFVETKTHFLIGETGQDGYILSLEKIALKSVEIDLNPNNRNNSPFYFNIKTINGKKTIEYLLIANY